MTLQFYVECYDKKWMLDQSREFLFSNWEILLYNKQKIREMLYLLNMANLDCCEYYHPERLGCFLPQAGDNGLPACRMEVQLYKSLLFLQRSVS